MRRILASVVLVLLVMGCESESTSEAEKPSDAETSSEVKKPSEPETPSQPKVPSEAEAKKAFEDGAAAYRSGDYATALRLLEPLAELGVAPAQLTVGLMYADGKGVPKNVTEALKWYQLAAEQGLADAQTNLGNMYLQGVGVLPNDAEAAKWFGRAAQQGDAKAQNNLGVMYATGKGLPPDPVQAYQWFALASSAQGKDGQDAANNRDRIASQMTQEQVAQAQKLVQDWKPNQTVTVPQ